MISVQKEIILDADGECIIYLTNDGTENGNILFSSIPIIDVCHKGIDNATLIGVSWELSNDFKTLSFDGTFTNANKIITINVYR